MSETHMNTISEFLAPQDIWLNVQVASIKRLFEEVGNRLHENHGISARIVVENLWSRELLGSTAIGQGVALPHARIQDLEYPIAAFVRPVTPLPFDAPDGKPVTDILFLLAPMHIAELGVEFLAEAARCFSDINFRNWLRACKDPESVYQLFSAWKPA